MTIDLDWLVAARLNGTVDDGVVRRTLAEQIKRFEQEPTDAHAVWWHGEAWAEAEA